MKKYRISGLTKYAYSFVFLLVIQITGISNEISNDHIIVKVSDQGAISFVDRKNQVQWDNNYTGWVELSDNGRTERIPLINSRIDIVEDNGKLNISFSGIRGDMISDENFLLRVSITLENARFEIDILELQTEYDLHNIEYPAHLLLIPSGMENGYVVVPNLQGILIPSRYDAGFMRYGQNIWEAISDIEKWWTFESGNLNMPWYGAVKGGSSVFAHVVTSSDCMLHVIGNAVVGSNGRTVNARYGQNPGTRISSLSPIWLASKQNLAYPRKLRIEIVDKGYLGMTERYKDIAKASGRFVTLKEKIRQNPEYEKIIGAPDLKIYVYTNRINDPYYRAWSEPVLNGYSRVNTSFQQVEMINEDLKKMNIEKCMILLGGWNSMGYDREHVDMWPPAESAGGVEDLKKAGEAVRKNGYLFALHDNYDDFYPDAPSFDDKYILRDLDGSLHRGGIWDGGPCYIICPAQRKELLDRNMDLIQKEIPLNAYYFDVITSTSHYECYDQHHGINRRQDLEYRLELLGNIVNRGLVIGGERGTDWALPHLAFCEGLSGGGTGYHRGIAYRTGIIVPLFYLVYRECVVGYWQHGTPHGREDHANHVLLDLLNGQPSSWSIEYAQWNDLKPLFRETYELLGRLHARTAHYPMVHHSFLSTDYMIQKSEFGDGTEIWVNFGIISYSDGKIHLPPKGFLVKSPGEITLAGSVSRSISYLQE